MVWVVCAALAWGGTEIPYDGLDQDGDGLDWVDCDGDGAPSILAGGTDCNDRDPRVHPEAWDWRGDGVDRDCDGSDGMVEGGFRRGKRRAAALWKRWGGPAVPFAVLLLLGRLAAPVPGAEDADATRSRSSAW